MLMQKNNFIFDRDTLLHLRLPFSFFLLPVYLFALSQTKHINYMNAIIVFISLHFFIYPASNLYNSFMDQDKGSIGGLRNPPPATRKLYIASMWLDALGLILCLLINIKMMLLMIVYISVSKVYSWHGIRLKKYALTGWLVVILFQGGYTFLLVNMAAENLLDLQWFTVKHKLCMLLATLLIGGFYPLTQVYQHEEDSERGDRTISYKLGIKGTFIFSAVMFIVACIVAWIYFTRFYNLLQFEIFIACLIPVVLYFLNWLRKVMKNEMLADYIHTMRMTMLSSVCMIICYSTLLWLNYQ